MVGSTGILRSSDLLREHCATSAQENVEVVADAEDVQAACWFDFTLRSIDSCQADSFQPPSRSLASTVIQNSRFVCSTYFHRCHLLAFESELAQEYMCFLQPAAMDSSEH